MIIFKKYSEYYNLLYNDKNYKKEATYIQKLIKKYNSKTKSILSVGCGTGKHDYELCHKGFDITGIDLSHEMIAIANKMSLFEKKVLFKQGDVKTINLNKKFDAVTSLFHVVSYLVENESLIKAFKNINTHLNKNGIFIFDIWYSPAVFFQKALPRIKKIKNEQLEIIRYAEPEIDINNNIVNVKYSINVKNNKNKKFDEFVENHKVRHFSIPEIKLLAKFTGFKVLCVEEFLTGDFPSEKTWGVCFVLQKQNVNV